MSESESAENRLFDNHLVNLMTSDACQEWLVFYSLLLLVKM